MEPAWLVWVREHMPKDLYEQFHQEWLHQASWRDDVISRLEAELQSIKAGKDAGLLSPKEVQESIQHAQARMQERTRLPSHCSECGEEQFMTEHGVCCPNGHGGAQSVEEFGRHSDMPCKKCGDKAVYVQTVSGDHQDVHIVCTACNHAYYVDGPDA